MRRTTRKSRITTSSGNVFADLGLDLAEAQVMAMRTGLMIALEKAIKAQGMTQNAAATVLGVSQGRVSDLMHHRADKFSLDMLLIFGQAGSAGEAASGRLNTGSAVRVPIYLKMGIATPSPCGGLCGRLRHDGVETMLKCLCGALSKCNVRAFRKQ